MRGNPHAAFDEAGAGNAAWSRWCDTRRRKSEPTGNTNFDLNRRASPRPYPRRRDARAQPRRRNDRSRHHRAHRCDRPGEPTVLSDQLPAEPAGRRGILSRVLFQRPSGSLSAFQAIELANAVATLSGNGDAFERLRRTLGVDSLDLSTSATGGALVATRAINDRISVGVTTGARPQDNGVNVDLDVTRHLRLQAGVDASGGIERWHRSRMGVQIISSRIDPRFCCGVAHLQRIVPRNQDNDLRT